MVKRTVMAVADRVVPVQEKLASRMQNIFSYKVPGRRACVSTGVWKTHRGMGYFPGRRVHMETWARLGLYTLALVANSEMKAFVPTSAAAINADASPWAGTCRQASLSCRQSLCTAFLEVAWILSRHEKNAASCSLPWEDQVEHELKILPPPCFTIKVKI